MITTEENPKYAQSLYRLGGSSGYEIMPGTRWSPDPIRPGAMVADPKGFYVNNLVLREANHRISALHGVRSSLNDKVLKLEAEVERLQGIIDTQPVLARAVLERLKADPHAADLFKFVCDLATLMRVEAA